MATTTSAAPVAAKKKTSAAPVAAKKNRLLYVIVGGITLILFFAGVGILFQKSRFNSSSVPNGSGGVPATAPGTTNPATQTPAGTAGAVRFLQNENDSVLVSFNADEYYLSENHLSNGVVSIKVKHR